MKKKFVILAGLAVLFLNWQTTVLFAEDFDGTIKSIEKCSPKKGKEFCKNLIISLQNGKEAKTRIVLDTAINHDREGIYFDRNEGDMRQNKSQAEEVKEIEKVIRERLKPGTKVLVNNSCKNGCTAVQVLVK